MDKDTFLEKIKAIGSYEKPEEMRAELSELANEANKVFESVDKANAEAQELREQHERDTVDMEALRKANMKLFTQVGTDKTPAKQVEEETGLKQEPVSRRKFADLYDDKGNFTIKK